LKCEIEKKNQFNKMTGKKNQKNEDGINKKSRKKIKIKTMRTKLENITL
jgi:hypothetical protein